MYTDEVQLVVMIEGIHGAGKTTIINRLRKKGAVVMDEAFIDRERHGIEPGTYLDRIGWLSEYFSRLAEHLNAGEKMIFIDRSPWAGCVYSPGENHKELVDRCIVDLKMQFPNMYIVVIMQHPPLKKVLKRLKLRLEREPGRAVFEEGDDRRTTMFYEVFFNPVAFNLRYLKQHSITMLLGEDMCAKYIRKLLSMRRDMLAAKREVEEMREEVVPKIVSETRIVSSPPGEESIHFTRMEVTPGRISAQYM